MYQQAAGNREHNIGVRDVRNVGSWLCLSLSPFKKGLTGGA